MHAILNYSEMFQIRWSVLTFGSFMVMTLLFAAIKILQKFTKRFIAICADFTGSRLFMEKITQQVNPFQLPATQPDDEVTYNLAKPNYLNMVNNNVVKQRAIESIVSNGMGNNTPKEFNGINLTFNFKKLIYSLLGTVDFCTDLENEIAKHLHMEEAIVYANAFVGPTTSPIIECDEGDYIFCDENINYNLDYCSRSSLGNIVYFKHNDSEDLENKLKEVLTYKNFKIIT